MGVNFDPQRGVPHFTSIRLKRKEKTAKTHFSPQARFDFLISFPVILLVVAFYFWTAMSNGKYPNAASSIYYPLLARSFVEGHLYLDPQPSPELLALKDPYDPKQNAPYRILDISLYHGKYYIQYGPTPVVLLFAPYYFLTYSDLSQKVSVALFCSLGFAISAQLFLMILRDHFPGVSVWLKLACVLSLGMADTCPYLIRRPDVYEAAISCAYFLLQLVFLSFYCAARRPQRAMLWLLLLSACLGAAVGARPHYVLIVPLFIAFLVWLWRQRVATGKPRAWLIFWALAPVSLIGMLIAAYNYARFGNPCEIGMSYSLSGSYNMSNYSATRLANLPYSLWYYFFSPPAFSCQFPFIRAWPFWRVDNWPDIGYSVEPVTGLFVSAPVSLLALASPLLLRKSMGPEKRPLVLTMGFVFLAYLVVFLEVLRMAGATMRYLVDFAPGLIFLGCLMTCYFHHAINNESALVRRLFAVGVFTILLLGCVSGLFLSFTGYFDFLRYGSPESYATLKWFFHPLEVVFKAIAYLFGG